jgi:prolipoprotein diacylglyceryltransferase
MAGARIYYLILFARARGNERLWNEVRNPERGGGAVFGSLVIVPFSFWLADWLRIPVAVYWDHMIFGIVAGAVWIRFGCVWNGCCGGKRTTNWYGVRMHDIRGTRERRIPVQWFEIGWWLLAGAGLLWLWPDPLPPGSYASGVLSWYGLGRFWLEPLREQSDIIAGRLRLNQVVAALLALIAGSTLIFLS